MEQGEVSDFFDAAWEVRQPRSKKVPATNSKLPIFIRLKDIDSILLYFRTSGYTIVAKPQGDDTFKAGGSSLMGYYTDAPGWGSFTPVIEVLKIAGKPTKCWFYIRLPIKPEFPSMPW